MANSLIKGLYKNKYLVITIIILLIIIFINTYYIEQYTSKPVNSKNNNVNVTFTPYSTTENVYTYLYQVTGLTSTKKKNVMKYVGGPSNNSKYSGKSGTYGWIIGLVKPPNVSTFDVKITFDKKVEISDGEIDGVFTLYKSNNKGYVSTSNNIVTIKYKTNEPQIMVSLKYV